MFRRAAVIALVLTILSSVQTVEAYHEHNTFYDDPYYYDNGRYNDYNYRPYYTHHQYHVISYRNHYNQYNQYHYYQPYQYQRYYYPRGRCKYPGDICIN